MKNGCVFNEDYYKNGLKLGISGYENYHYIPQRSYSEAIELLNRFEFENILDYGCSLGYLVHTLRQLGKMAYGEDISDYALKNCLPDIVQYCSYPSDQIVDFIFSKDTLEHIDYCEIEELLNKLYKRCNKALFVIPLGDNGKFRVTEYEIDRTHIIKQDEDWWINILRKSDFKIKSFAYSMGAIKKHWLSVNEYGNGFFTVEGGC
jgi:hypothetical protein